jgi:hypothetical protein
MLWSVVGFGGMWDVMVGGDGGRWWGRWWWDVVGRGEMVEEMRR